MLRTKIAGVRHEYKKAALHENDLDENPIIQFKKWLDEALRSSALEPTAMTLATCDADGKPSARIVLLKDVNEKGFVFFTNYESKKGKQLAQNNYAALVFFWKELERQVRIEGTVQKTSKTVSDEYFLSRPAGSRISAWASPQSKIISAEEIATQVKKVKAKFNNNEVTKRPSFWGGYLLQPSLIELWQGRPNRLHDRIEYRLQKNNSWEKNRLAP